MNEIFDTNCPFCTELSGVDSPKNFLFQRLTSFGCNSRIVMETEHFSVMPTVGCFVEGYLLIVSKRHFFSVADLPTDVLVELAELIEVVKAKIKAFYGLEVICFEHGSPACAVDMGSCIDHAHLHILPFDGCLTELIQPFSLPIKKINTLLELRQYGEKQIPYLFWRDADNAMYVIDEGFVPSQFFRRLIADHNGIPNNWDWRSFPYIDNILKTICAFKLDVIHDAKR